MLALKSGTPSALEISGANSAVPTPIETRDGPLRMGLVSRISWPFPNCSEVLSSNPNPKGSGRRIKATKAATAPAEEPPIPVSLRFLEIR